MAAAEFVLAANGALLHLDFSESAVLSPAFCNPVNVASHAGVQSPELPACSKKKTTYDTPKIISRSSGSLKMKTTKSPLSRERTKSDNSFSNRRRAFPVEELTQSSDNLLDNLASEGGESQSDVESLITFRQAKNYL